MCLVTVIFKMASVVFIIRIPYEEEDPESSKTDEHGQPKSSDRNKVQGISRPTNDNDHNRSNGTKEINDNDNEPFDQNEAEIIDNSNRTNRSADDVEILTGPLNLAEVLQHELRSLEVQGASWTVTNDKEFHQVLFLEKTGERVEKILARLTLVGIGKRQKSSVSIIPTSVHIQPAQKNVAKGVISQCESIPTSEIETQPLLVDEESTKDQFKRSIKSRLTVEQVVEGIRMQALLTFDFVMFTVLASLIAAVGLVEDNAVVLVASFLVSPLMGPILGGTFGAMIKNKSLRNTGLKTELYGLILSVVVGFLFGFICGPFGVNGASWDSAKGIWPTPEMTSRGMTRGLWVGVLIALPSGAAVALSVLGGNTCPLVGVAISASLLTPAVNFGMLWAYSIITAIKPPELMENAEFNTSKSKCPPFKDNSYTPTYSCDMGTEAAIMAIISLVLTVVNIICIFITATIVLKIKKVASKASSSNATQTFWTKDIKVAREAYETLKGNQATNLLKEWKKVQDRTKEGYRYPLQEIEELLDIVKEVEEEEDFQSVVRRAPRGAQNIHQFSRLLWKLVSKDDVDENITDKEAMNLQNQLRNLQTYYTLQSKEKNNQPHVGTIFNEPESSPKPSPKLSPKLSPKPKKGVREFHVVETENPHHASVVRVHPPNEDSNTYSVTTESGV